MTVFKLRTAPVLFVCNECGRVDKGTVVRATISGVDEFLSEPPPGWATGVSRRHGATHGDSATPQVVQLCEACITIQKKKES